MSGVTAGSVRAVLSGPGVRRTFACALVGRLTYGVLPLSFLFTVRESSGSFALAAAASAALGLATLAMPVQSRLVDRHGQRRVLPAYAAAYVAVLVTAAALDPPGHAWLVVGALLGLCAPALGPAMRAQWREIAAEGAPRRVAYSLDSIGEESLYLLGPLVAGLVLATGPAAVGLLVAAALVAVGTTALVCSPYVPGAGARVAHTRGELRPLRPLLAGVLLFGAAGATALVGTAALADRAGRPAVMGVVEAAVAVGAIGGGIVWARSGRARGWRVLVAVSAAAQAAAALAAPHLLLVGACLVVTGAVAAPVFVLSFTAADTLVAPERRTEASTWVSAAYNAGSAGGTALAGLLAASSAAPFAVAAALSGAAVGFVAVTRIVRIPGQIGPVRR